MKKNEQDKADLREKVLGIQQGLAAEASNLRARYETNQMSSSEFSLRIARPITDSTDKIMGLFKTTIPISEVVEMVNELLNEIYKNCRRVITKNEFFHNDTKAFYDIGDTGETFDKLITKLNERQGE